MERKERALMEYLRRWGPVAVAFSGGTDSAYVLYAAVKAGIPVTAYYARSVFQPAFEREDARRFCQQWEVPLREIPVDILSVPAVVENTPARCYYCKRTLFSALWEAVRADGIAALFDGTNATDHEDDRPGMAALKELAVHSPLRECGVTKDEVRALSRRAGLFTWDKPAYACLATRIPTGTAVRLEDLRRTESAEMYLADLGFRDYRVRLCGGAACIQVPKAQMPLLWKLRADVVARLKQDYPAVMLDLEGRP